MRKQFFVLLLTIIQIESFAQLTVLCSRNSTSVKTQSKLKALNEIGKGEVIRIDSAGYLLLADAKWNLFEFKDKGIVATDSLKGFLIVRSADPNYSILFSTEPLTTAIVDYRICKEFVYGSFPYSRSFEITWPIYFWSNCSACKVSVVDEFDEKVSQLEFKLREWTEFDLTSLVEKRKKKRNKLIIRINQNQKCSQVPDFYVFGQPTIKSNNINYDKNRASTKMLMALYFEQIGYFEKALEIYLEALNASSLNEEIEELLNQAIVRVRKR